MGMKRTQRTALQHTIIASWLNLPRRSSRQKRRSEAEEKLRQYEREHKQLQYLKQKAVLRKLGIRFIGVNANEYKLDPKRHYYVTVHSYSEMLKFLKENVDDYEGGTNGYGLLESDIDELGDAYPTLYG